MNYEVLTKAYWDSQVARVEELRRKIVLRTETAPGRVVPDDEALVVGTGRQLPMCVLFLDISGFSGRPAESAEEQDVLLRALNLFFSEMVRIAEDYGGTVEKNTGDGLMAYFEDGGGDPPESGAKRAVASSLTMVAANEFLIRPILDASGITPIEFRFGIEYGLVTVARLGPARRFNANVAIGTTANIASKLLALARPGEILIGHNARERLPVTWRIPWTKRREGPSGWVFRHTSGEYPVYRYTGRWAQLF